MIFKNMFFMEYERSFLKESMLRIYHRQLIDVTYMYRDRRNSTSLQLLQIAWDTSNQGRVQIFFEEVAEISSGGGKNFSEARWWRKNCKQLAFLKLDLGCAKLFKMVLQNMVIRLILSVYPCIWQLHIIVLY